MIDISAQCRTLSPDYLLMFSNEVCMWARFQGNIHDAHVGTGNHRRNQKLSRDPLQDLWEAFQRGEREQSGREKNERRGPAVSSRSKTSEGLTSLDQWWCFQGLWGHMWPWSQTRPLDEDAVSPGSAFPCGLFFPLELQFEAEKDKELAFSHRSSKTVKVYEQRFVLCQCHCQGL